MPCLVLELLFSGFFIAIISQWIWSGSICKKLQEIQAVAMILKSMVFQLSDKVVALHLDNNTAKAYLCSQGGTVSCFLSRMASQILKSNWQAQYYSFSTIHSYLSQCGSWLSVTGQVASEVASSSYCSSCISALGSTRGGSVGILMYHSLSVILHLWKIHYLWGALGLNTFNHPWTYQVKLHLSPCYISFSSSVSGRTCHRSIQTVDSSGTVLDRAP